MDISSIGSSGGTAWLMNGASSAIGDDGSSAPPSGSDSSSGGDESIAAAQYGFDGRVLAMQASAISQLFSALA
jgi:hypothetical protein